MLIAVARKDECTICKDGAAARACSLADSSKEADGTEASLQPQTAELFRPRLDELINMKHPLVKLVALIDWAEIERTFAVSFTSGAAPSSRP